MRVNKPMTRGWQDYWDWNDKSIKECGAAKDILEAAKVRIVDLRVREEKEQPPDCEAFLDSLLAAIQARIDKKDAAHKVKGGPYKRYVIKAHGQL